MEDTAEVRVIYSDDTLKFEDVLRIIVRERSGGEREVPREEWGTRPIGEFAALHIQTPMGFGTIFPEGVRVVQVRARRL